jgi:hypothetical protein
MCFICCSWLILPTTRQTGSFDKESPPGLGKAAARVTRFPAETRDQHGGFRKSQDLASSSFHHDCNLIMSLNLPSLGPMAAPYTRGSSIPSSLRCLGHVRHRVFSCQILQSSPVLSQQTRPIDPSRWRPASKPHWTERTSQEQSVDLTVQLQNVATHQSIKQ